MYNLVWQSATCWPGKLRILLSLKNRNAEPAAPTARDDVASPWGYPGEKRATPVTHPDCRWRTRRASLLYLQKDDRIAASPSSVGPVPTRDSCSATTPAIRLSRRRVQAKALGY